MATIAQKDDLVRSHLNSVNTILLQKKSTSELLRLPEPPVRRPFTIRVENKIIKKDRLPYATGNEKEANLPRNDKSKSNKRKPKNTRKFIVGTTPESKLNK
ncbi:hypothetical protein EB796_009127 [Bugula neritina]|uniref:Uncharacterized protein n=1 Tax=Bugula neritina TaxID=10212 RepID=A0A7J7K4L8_BUGNE|nr:hypothetical protein EB796_009127 [Bugula neritina]